MPMEDLTGWTGCPRPGRHICEGRFVRLEPLDAVRHGDGLFACATIPGEAERFTYLPDRAPRRRQDLDPWLATAQASEDPLFFAVLDRATGKVGGRQSLMRIHEQNGVIEIGNIYWSKLVARRPAATEAFYLWARYIFDDLGYRRFEWKCDNANEPSKRAARRFGMTHEGVFRQALVVKGRNRDTAWFSIIDKEWPALRQAFEAWLDPTNFDTAGQQLHALESLRA